MNARRGEAPAEGPEVARSVLEASLLNVQSERVALTEAFMLVVPGCGPKEMKTVLLRLLRLRRASDYAEGLAIRNTVDEDQVIAHPLAF